jgi:hypothetical protein
VVEHVDDDCRLRAGIPADGDVLARADLGGVRDVVPRGRQDPADGGPVADGCDRDGRPAAAGSGHDEIDVPEPGLAEGAQGRGLAGGGVDDQDGGVVLAGPRAPEVEAFGQLDRLVAWSGRAPRRRRHDGEHRDGHEHRGHEVVAAAGPAVGGVDRRAGDEEDDGAAAVELGEGEAGGGVGDGGDPPEEDSGRQVEEGGQRFADEAGRDAADEAPHHDRAGGGGGQEVGR